MTLMLSGLMLYTMWVVLALIGIDLLVDIYKSLTAHSFAIANLADFLNGILSYIFPLFILASLTALDPTGWLVLIAYYTGAVGVIFKYISDIQRKLS